ncbi:MAG: hypothetical protein M3Z19_08945 [Chloroflexota bacterium]|nr:hypothetical protein [Chloroflexota bacterium]
MSLLRTSNLEPRTLVWLVAAVVVTAVLLTGAYQVRPTYRIAVGNAASDTALVRDFYGPERQPATDGGARFRWTRGNGQIVLPGIGRGAVAVDLLLSGSANPAPDTRVLANETEIATLHLTPDFRTYHVEVPAALMAHGTLELALATAPFTPRGDRRVLGIVVRDITVHTERAGFALPPARIALSLWVGALCVALALLIAGFGGGVAFVGATVVAGGMAAFLVGNRFFLTVDAGGVVRAGALMVAATAAIRFLFAPLCRRVGLATTARDVRWLALIGGATLALRFAGMLHPSIVIVDLKFHLHRFADVADMHRLLLPIQSAEFGGRTVLYAPTPYLFMLPLAWIIRDRVLMLFLFSLGVDLARFCILWLVAHRVTRDLLAANLVVLTMALMPVGWIVYSWGTFANVFAEGTLTLLFALLALGYGRLAGPNRRRWCAVFAAVICLALLAHVGVFVLAALTVALYLAMRLGLAYLPPRPPASERRGERIAASLFALAGLAAALVAFALFYRFPARDLLAGSHAAPVEQEATNTRAATVRHEYTTGGATPDDRIGLPAVTTSHLSVALVREAWETSFAFYRVWPVLACIAGAVVLWRAGRTEEGNISPVLIPPTDHRRAAALTIAVWMAVAAIMLVVGIVARLYVRYPLFALPAVAFGGGIALAWLVRRAWWGRYLAAALLAFSGITTLLMWYDRIAYAFKPLV